MSLKTFCVLAVAVAAVGCGSDPEVMGGAGGAAGFGGTAGIGGTGGVGGTAGIGGMAGIGGTGGVGGTAGVGGTGGVGGQTLEEQFPGTDWNALEIIYPTSYSGFDGVHTFKLPMRVKCTNVPLSAWHASPASAVTFDADPDNADGVMVTIVEAVPEIKIGVVNSGLGGQAPIHVTIGTPAEWELGNFRYNNGADWSLNIAMPEAPPPNTKCTVCHTDNSSTGFNIQHTPTQLARASDQALVQIMTTGTKPADVPFRVLPATITFGFETFTNAQLYKEFHLWDGDAEHLKGMVLYLRSLTPKGQGCVMNPMTGMCEDVSSATDGCN